MCACSTKIHTGHFDEFEKLSKTMFLQGRVYSDIFNHARLLLNGLPLKITFRRHKNNVTLLSAAENPEFKASFQEVIFSLRKVQ